MKMNNNSCYYWNLCCFLNFLRVRRFKSEEVTIVAATCHSLRNDTLGLNIFEHLLEADHISLHLVRLGMIDFCFGYLDVLL